MKLTPLFQGDYIYTGDLEVVVSPYDEDVRMQLFGGGDGQVRGERLSGRVEWVNAPSFRSDGVFLPTVRGVILTSDGARVRFDTQGYSLPPLPDAPYLRRICASMRFYSKADGYQWLGNVIGLEEGVLDVRTGRIRTQAYECVHDFVGEPA